MVSARTPFVIAVVFLSLASTGNALQCYVCKDCTEVTNKTEVVTCKGDEITTTVVPSTDNPNTGSTAVPTGSTAVPTVPTTVITTVPTTVPTTIPTTIPTTVPTTVPTTIPTTIPTTVPTTIPTTLPTTVPTTIPTTVPTTVPTTIPTTVPTTTSSTVPIVPGTGSKTEHVNPPSPSVIVANYLSRQRRDSEEQSSQCVKVIYKVGDKERTDRGCQIKVTDEKKEASCARLTGITEDKVLGCGVCEKDTCNSASMLQISFPIVVSLMYLTVRSIF